MAAKSEAAAVHSLLWLEQTAAADPRNAGPKLVSIARRFCEAVADWVEKCPEEATDLARKLPDWPALHGRHFAIKKDTGELLEKLKLGEDHPVASAIMPKTVVDPVTGKKRKRKGIDLSKGANRQAAMIFDAITESRRTFLSDLAQHGLGRMPKWRIAAETLNPLSVLTGEEWFNAGWLACDESGLIEKLIGDDGRPLGHYRRFHKPAERASVREGTMTRVRDAFYAMIGNAAE